MSFSNIRNVVIKTGKEFGLVGTELSDYVEKTVDRYVQFEKIKLAEKNLNKNYLDVLNVLKQQK